MLEAHIHEQHSATHDAWRVARGAAGEPRGGGRRPGGVRGAPRAPSKVRGPGAGAYYHDPSYSPPVHAALLTKCGTAEPHTTTP
uniref:SFRICE_000939 n=1 Tax=Spodoptera frugiperda TaxID=7108 RepID=A0A2H1V9H5_SPOFR